MNIIEISINKLPTPIILKRLEHSDAEALFQVVEENRQYLRNWLPWLDINTAVKNTFDFISATITQYEAGLGPQYGIWYKKNIVGVIGFVAFNKREGKADFGYWLAENMQGKGIISHCVQELTKEVFEKYEIQCVRIRAAVNNHKSRAIAERLGFKYMGILKAKENLYGKIIDHALYVLENVAKG